MGRGRYKKKQAHIINLEQKIQKPTEEIKEELKISEPLYKVQVVQVGLRRRAAPSQNADIMGIIRAQDFLKIYAEEKGWGRLGDGTWIALQYTQKI